MKKYELITESKMDWRGRTLFRIRALVTFTTSSGEEVKAGDIGGWVEKEENLSHENKAWIYEHGKVLGGVIHGGVIYGGEIWSGIIHGGVIRDGVIRGGVIWSGVIRGGVIHGGVIYGGEIHGGVIYGGEIYGGEIHGGEISKSPLFIQGTRWAVSLAFYAGNEVRLKIGCKTLTLKEWREKYEEIAQKENAEDLIDEYLLYIELFAKLYGQDEGESDD